jgi:hypothetical protein
MPAPVLAAEGGRRRLHAAAESTTQRCTVELFGRREVDIQLGPARLVDRSVRRVSFSRSSKCFADRAGALASGAMMRSVAPDVERTVRDLWLSIEFAASCCTGVHRAGGLVQWGRGKPRICQIRSQPADRLARADRRAAAGEPLGAPALGHGDGRPRAPERASRPLGHHLRGSARPAPDEGLRLSGPGFEVLQSGPRRLGADRKRAMRKLRSRRCRPTGVDDDTARRGDARRLTATAARTAPSTACPARCGGRSCCDRTARG